MSDSTVQAAIIVSVVTLAGVIVTSATTLFGVLLGALPTYLIARNQQRMELERFYSQRWWEKKVSAYSEIIGSLVVLTHSLDRWIRHEVARQQNDNEAPQETQEDYEVTRNEYEEVRIQIERAATEGEYIISEEAAKALSALVKQLRKYPGLTTYFEYLNYLNRYLKAAQDCLQTIRAEAQSDLRVK